MDVALQLMNSVSGIGIFLAAFPALWISGRIILRNYASDDRTTQIFLWLILGGLILTPLNDFLRYLGSVLSLIIPSLWNSGTISVFLGVGPFLLYSTITLILGVIIYALAVYYTRKMVAQGKIPILQELQLDNWELGFVLLGIAGLINHMVSGLVVTFVNINVPIMTARQDLAQLSKGFWISWLIAFLILLVLLFIMNDQVYRRKNKHLP